MSMISIVRRLWPAGVLACVSLLGCQGSADENGAQPFDANRINIERIVALSGPHGDGTHFETMAPKHLLGFLFRDVSAASGLPILADVPMSVLTEAQQLEQLSALAEEEIQNTALQQMGFGSEAALLALGLDRFLADEIQGDEVPPDEDDIDLPLPSDFVVAGYYDTNKKQFFLSDGVTSEYRAHVMRHELMHALQDQHFNLDKRIMACLPDLDALLAFKAVVEGQAEFAAMRAKALRPPSLSLLPALKRRIAGPRMASKRMALPGWRKPRYRAKMGSPGEDLVMAPDMSMFPYQEGALFFADLVRDGADRGYHFPYWVQETFRVTPLRTHDILHPLQWAENRFAPPPAPLSLHAFEGIDSHRVLWQSSLGELVTRAYLWGADNSGAMAASMTRDRVVVLEQPSSTLPAVAWVTEWPHRMAATRFAQAATRAQAKLAERKKKLDIAPSGAIVQQVGNRVGLLLEVARELDHPAASADHEPMLVDALQRSLYEVTNSSAL